MANGGETAVQRLRRLSKELSLARALQDQEKIDFVSGRPHGEPDGDQRENTEAVAPVTLTRLSASSWRSRRPS
jgi:hypothetical protein